MARLAAVQERLANAGKLGPSLRLLPTTSATTLRKTQDPPLVIDGPFAETKEQLLGFYVIDVASLDEALDIARELAAANPGGAYEIRPVALYNADQRAAAGA
ncbi:MAG TPA: YciI family protein, partial [Stellaceae bacterium]|nr:YciI family protein [Stellaceae bacterium]